MPESYSYDPKQELADRLADLSMLYSLQAGEIDTFESALLTHGPIGHRELFNPETGTLISISDPPLEQRYELKVMLTVRNTREGATFNYSTDEDEQVEANELVFCVDHDDQPYIMLSDQLYEEVDPEQLARYIDGQLPELEARHDWRLIPDEVEGGLETISTPQTLYTLAAGAEGEAVERSGVFFALMIGDLPDYPHPGEGTLPYSVSIAEHDNPRNWTGFNRFFSIATSMAEIGLMPVIPLGKREVEYPATDRFEVIVDRQDAHLRYEVEGPEGEKMWRHGQPAGGYDFLVNYVKNARSLPPIA